MAGPEERKQLLRPQRERRGQQATERAQEPMRHAVFAGAAIGLIAGVVLGQSLFGDALITPILVALGGMALGAATGAGLILRRDLAAERARFRAESAKREEERQARKIAPREARRSGTLTSARAIATPVGSNGGADDPAFIVPPGFYPDPRGEAPMRRWDGERWTEETARAPITAARAAG
jgi:Protein of unknown function (DUF2510)